MYEPPIAPSPATAPSPQEVGGASPRYVYLIGRLRRREITMEEATELFTLQQSALGAMAARARPVPPPPPPESGRATYPASPGVPAPIRLDEEGLAYGLLLLGAGAGVLAAVLKRTREGPPVEGPKRR